MTLAQRISESVQDLHIQLKEEGYKPDSIEMIADIFDINQDLLERKYEEQYGVKPENQVKDSPPSLDYEFEYNRIREKMFRSGNFQMYMRDTWDDLSPLEQARVIAFMNRNIKTINSINILWVVKDNKLVPRGL